MCSKVSCFVCFVCRVFGQGGGFFLFFVLRRCTTNQPTGRRPTRSAMTHAAPTSVFAGVRTILRTARTYVRNTDIYARTYVRMLVRMTVKHTFFAAQDFPSKFFSRSLDRRHVAVKSLALWFCECAAATTRRGLSSLCAYTHEGDCV